MDGDEEALVELRLKWFDDSTLLSDDGEELLRQALRSLGVTSRPAFEVFRVLLIAHKGGVRVSARQVREQVVKSRAREKERDRRGLTLRNIQVWLKYFCDIGFLDCVGDKYMFKAARKPSECFNEYTVPLIDECARYTRKAFEAVEDAFKVK